MSTALINDITIAYGDSGSGPALVLVHGHPFDRTMWQPQVEWFSRAGWRVVTPDLRGYGESTVVPGKTTLEDFARDIVGLADQLGIERFVLGGLSMGGQIVLEMVWLFPQRIRGLLLADTSAPAESDAGKRHRNQLADRLLREGVESYAEEVLPRMLASYTIERHPDLAQFVLDMMRGTPAEGAAAALRGRAERPDYVELLARIEVPTLVVVGRDDSFTPISEAQLMYERIPNASLAVIEGAAHMPNLERPDEFNQALSTLLDAVSRESAEAQ